MLKRQIRNTGRRRRFLCALLAAALLAACLPFAAWAEEDPKTDVDIIMARNAVICFGVRDDKGNLISPRKAPELHGRGIPDAEGKQPDYRGVVGYMAIQDTWEVTGFTTFAQTPWQLPVYQQKVDGWKVSGSIRHKTPVLVTDQLLRKGSGQQYEGYLRVVRLDTGRQIWVDAAQFVTVAYWTLPLQEAVKYGFCIAVYRNESRSEPMDLRGHRGPIPEGTRVLTAATISSRYSSPDAENNPMPGILFRPGKEDGADSRIFLFFSLDDLALVY